jgi:hypothetical protein
MVSGIDAVRHCVQWLVRLGVCAAGCVPVTQRWRFHGWVLPATDRAMTGLAALAVARNGSPEYKSWTDGLRTR